MDNWQKLRESHAGHSIEDCPNVEVLRGLVDRMAKLAQFAPVCEDLGHRGGGEQHAELREALEELGAEVANLMASDEKPLPALARALHVARSVLAKG